MQGTVSIEGQIGTDGRMKDMRVLSSPHPAFVYLSYRCCVEPVLDP